MKTSSSSRSGLFLMELIISILFFSLAGAVCVRLFVNSHIVSQNSVELNYALEWSQNVAEVFYGCNGDFDQMIDLFQSQFGNCTIASSGRPTFYLSFDDNFEPFTAANDDDHALCYNLWASIEQEEELLYCHIFVQKKPSTPEVSAQETIYELTVSLFPQKEVSN